MPALWEGDKISPCQKSHSVCSESYLHLYCSSNYHIFSRCFPHIVNLACQAVLRMLTSMEFIDETTEGYQEYDVEGNLYNKDLIATIHSLISTVCSQVFAFTNILLINFSRLKTAV